MATGEVDLCPKVQNLTCKPEEQGGVRVPTGPQGWTWCWSHGSPTSVGGMVEATLEATFGGGHAGSHAGGHAGGSLSPQVVEPVTDCYWGSPLSKEPRPRTSRNCVDLG